MTGRAPALKLLIEHGAMVDDCVAAFPSVTPVCAASIATGVGPDQHDIPSMNWYHRGEGRYVEYGTSFKASQTLRLQALAHRHDLQHEPRAPVEGRQDGVRVARRRRHPHRRHDLPDVPRAPPPRGHERHRAHAAGLDGLPPRRLRPARVLLRRHLRLAQDGLPRPARPAGPARPARRAASARTWSRTTCATSCCSRCPTTTRTRTRTGRSRRSPRSPRPTSSSSASCTPRAGPEAFLEDYAMIVCSDHSQSQVEREIDVFKAFDGFGARAADADARAPRRRAAGDRGLPVVALGAGLRARPRPPRPS